MPSALRFSCLYDGNHKGYNHVFLPDPSFGKCRKTNDSGKLKPSKTGQPTPQQSKEYHRQSMTRCVSHAIREKLPETPRRQGQEMQRKNDTAQPVSCLTDSTCSYPVLPPRSDKYFPYSFVPNPAPPEKLDFRPCNDYSFYKSNNTLLIWRSLPEN